MPRSASSRSRKPRRPGRPAEGAGEPRERLLPAMAGLRDTIGGSDDDAGALARAFVAGIHAIVARNPWLPSIWVREILTEGGALREMMVAQGGAGRPPEACARAWIRACWWYPWSA